MVDNKCSHLFGVGRSWPISRGKRSLIRVSILDATAPRSRFIYHFGTDDETSPKELQYFFLRPLLLVRHLDLGAVHFFVFQLTWPATTGAFGGLLASVNSTLSHFTDYLKHLWAQIWHWKDGGYWRPSWVAMDSEIVSLTPFLRCRMCN